MAKTENEKVYSIDFKKLERQGFSSEFLISEKLNSAGIKTKGSESLDQLLSKCSKFKKVPYEFITPELSLSESIIRTLLIRKNSKTGMHQIQSDLSAVWLDHYKLPYKNISDAGVSGILEKSGFFINSKV
ncbi:MAG: hypothetical protein VX590_04520 [Chloroflexota bacterium]|nr:hypothetical protein [Chloroflexota bacterium]|tara:strand:- start:5990 stop:6379 length:390 start_codon:yes stop_codon:yes gene_type:complete